MRCLMIAATALVLGALGLGACQTPNGGIAAAPRVILVGDSTIAKGSGWGDAFCAELKEGVTCRNMAKGGRSSKSYRAEGSWNEVLAEMQTPTTGPTYVIISFGHNDQPGKTDRSSDFATEFAPNMARYVSEIRAAGAKPVLLTPLTRRQFSGGMLQDGLAPWSAAIRDVARETGTPLLDLASDSVRSVQVLGPVQVMGFAQGSAPASVVEAAKSGTTIEAPKDGPTPAPGLSADERAKLGDPKGVFDYTHLGPVGARYFASLVREEVGRAVPELAAWLRPRG